MDKRYQVFVSSTYEDLKDERSTIMQTLLELECIPAGMELFPAADEDQWGVIKKVIDDCDYYIIIIGGRYGSTNKDGISFTEMEYDYAVQTGKPIIAFLIKDPSKLPASKTEFDVERRKKLELFRDKAKKKLCKLWDNPAELSKAVSTSMVKLIKTCPATGWVKANFLQPQEILEQKQNDLVSYQKFASVGLSTIYSRQGDFNSWIELIQQAEKEVDIQGRTLYGWTQSHLTKEVILEKIMKHKVKFRWLIMDNNNKYLENLIEENHGIGDMLKEKAHVTKTFLSEIKQQIHNRYKSCFEVRYFDNVPLYCSIIRIDSRFFVSNYLYSSPSNDSPFMQLEDGSKAWPRTYRKEFETLWKNAKK